MDDSLINQAENAAKLAYAPYSQYPVGAALQTQEGRIYTGCNIENASYGATVCAERVAVFKAISEGEKKFKKMAIFSEKAPVPTPCGICRQILWELTGDIPIVVKSGKKVEKFQLSDLIPSPFALKS